jgi:sulfur-oxidizing protein SoxY
MVDETLPATRRGFLTAAGGLALVTVLPVPEGRATPDTMKAAIRKAIGDRPIRKGKVTLDVPPIVENGNSVALEVKVDSPMTLGDHVKAIHVFNEKNPQPNIVSVRLSPRSGRAQLATRVRLADSQNIIAIAEMSDGTCWSDDVDVVVTIAACLETP